jgi:phosphotransacetylase
MEILELKEKIYSKIEVSDKKILEAIYTLLENNTSQGFGITDEEAEEINKDVADYLSGKTKGYTREEVKKKIREIS